MSHSYLLQHGVLLLGRQPQVPLLTSAELGRLLLELLLALLHGADLVAPEPLQGLDELLVSPLQLQKRCEREPFLRWKSITCKDSFAVQV